MEKLIKLPESQLLFRYNQRMEDPRDGLTLFGPLDEGAPYGIRAGVIGTRAGIAHFSRWVDWVQRPVFNVDPKDDIARPPFPGFESAFKLPWTSNPILALEIDETELYSQLHLDDRHQRVFGTVDLFCKRIIKAIDEEEDHVDVWFIVIPDAVKKYCRPKSVVESVRQIKADKVFVSAKQAKAFYNWPSLFAAENEAAEPYFYKEHFRNQLKAKLLEHRISTQVVQESTLANIGKFGEEGVARKKAKIQSAIAWHIATAAFYKSGGRPWKVANVRDGVCYLGLVFKQDTRLGDSRSACCGAQMFLDSGDGVVFKGAIGQWYAQDTGEYHLNQAAAKELIELAIRSYKEKNERKPPREVFIHGQVTFNRDEWRGFEAAVGSETNIVGVKIRDDASLKVFRKSDTPVLRGMAHIRNERSAFLWTRGWVPRLQTYPGREVPNPLTIEICRGSAPIETVLADILALTKLNYNACVFGDGKPITLKFANAVGDVLTAGPIGNIPPLPFQYYI